MDTIEQGRIGRSPGPGPRRGSIAGVVAVSLLTGLVLAVVVVMVPVVPTRTTSLTGAILVAFGVGWALLAALSVVLTDHPQRWAIAPAAFMGLAAGVAFTGSAAVHAIFSWSGPCCSPGLWSGCCSRSAGSYRAGWVVGCSTRWSLSWGSLLSAAATPP